MSRVADDDVVDELDPEDLPGPDQFAGDFDVAFGRLGLAAGMVMRPQDGGGGHRDGYPVHFPWMDEDAVHRADGHQMVTLDAPSGVEHQDNETLAIRVEMRVGLDMGPPVGDSAFGCVAEVHVLGHEALAQGSDLPFLGLPAPSESGWSEVERIVVVHDKFPWW